MFGTIIKGKRIEKKMTLQQVADAIDGHKGYISGMERGAVRPPSPRIVKKIASVLDLDYQDLLCMSVIPKLPKDINKKVLADFLLR
jgi:transcriptional regulator with XRE-family HTH domain